MHDRALQHHCAGADVEDASVIIEGEHARRDEHELEAARRQMQMEIRRARILAIDRKIGRDLVQQEGLVIGVEAIVGSVVERLRPIGRLVVRILLAIEGDELLPVQLERIAVGMKEASKMRRDPGVFVHLKPPVERSVDNWAFMIVRRTSFYRNAK